MLTSLQGHRLHLRIVVAPAPLHYRHSHLKPRRIQAIATLHLTFHTSSLRIIPTTITIINNNMVTTLTTTVSTIIAIIIVIIIIITKIIFFTL